MVIKLYEEDLQRLIRTEVWADGHAMLILHGKKIEFSSSKECTDWIEALRRMWRLVREDED